MPIVPYATIPTYIQTLTPFVGSSSSAYRYGEIYEVRARGTTIFLYNEETGWFEFDNRKIDSVSQKVQNIIKGVFEIPIYERIHIVGYINNSTRKFDSVVEITHGAV